MAKAPTILVIDDSFSACAFMSQALVQVGYRVVTAGDAVEGWNRTVQERPDCLIIDVILPGPSGFDLCRQVRQWAGQEWPAIVLVSTKATPLDLNWGMRQGANYYLGKPFTQETLVQVVNSVLP